MTFTAPTLNRNTEPALEIQNLTTKIAGKILHKDLNLTVQKGEILGIIGGSGSGKTVLLNHMIGLYSPYSGTIHCLGLSPHKTEEHDLLKFRWGVLFQSGALFSTLTVGENIAIPLQRILRLSREESLEIAHTKMRMVGLSSDAFCKFPSELSGGMIKRTSLARALSIDPEIVFLDEPTSGLDPIASRAFDDLLKKLQNNLSLTVVMITHDPLSAQLSCNRLGVLLNQKLEVGPVRDILRNSNPWIQGFFKGTNVGDL